MHCGLYYDPRMYVFVVGLCIGKREQCEFVLRNESSKAVAVRMNMTAEIDILYAVGNPESVSQ